MNILTTAGPVELEDYVARVVTAENGGAATEALKAQAVISRTYLLRAMRDDAKLGVTKPVAITDFFQVMAPVASASAIAATQATAGQVASWSGKLIIANYDGGSKWVAKGQPRDKSNAEPNITYNEGKSGPAAMTGDGMRMTPQSSKRIDNRGALSSNGADWLARNAGYDYQQILRYFYGADLDIGTPGQVPILPGAVAEPMGPLPALVGAVVGFLIVRSAA